MNRFLKKTLSLMMIFALVIGFACSAGISTADAATKTIHLKKTNISRVVGQTYQQQLISASGKVISATKVTWKSAKPAVAKINKKGKITAVKAGTAKMTATYKGTTYKFTVKVSKPFAPGEKPILIVEGSGENIIIKWDGKSLSGLKGELMYNVNEGEYEAYEGNPISNGFSMPGTYWNKYAFKLRWYYYDSVNKKEYRSEYSDEQTITLTPDHNTSVIIDPEEITLEIGEEKTIYVKTDAGKSLTYEKGSNVTCKWGGWLPDGSHTNTLKVTGAEEGEATLVVHDKKDPEVKDSVKVIVNPEWTIICDPEVTTENPLTITVKTSGGEVMYRARIESLSLTTSDDSFRIKASGTMLEYKSGSPDLRFRVTDQEGYVVTGGTLHTYADGTGLTFRINQTFEIPDAKGAYTLRFYN